MKRVFVYLSVLSMVLGLMAFECSSAELTGAKLYIQQKQYEKAKEALQKEIAKNPLSDEAFYLLGYLYGEEGDIQLMKDNFNKSLAVSKKFETEILESNKYYWATNFNKGVNDFNKATKATAKDTVAIFYEKSITDFSNAIILAPDSIAAYTNLVYTYFNMGRQDDAIPVLEKAMKISSSSDIIGMLGQLYNEKGVKSMDSYRATKIVDDSLKAMGWYAKAITVLEEGRTKFPDNSDILLRLSNAYIGSNKLDVAITAFKAGVEKEPENKYYRYNYGVLLLNSKDYPGAEAQFSKAVAIDPGYTNATYNLAVTYIRWGAQIREEMEAKGEITEGYKDKFNLALPLLEKYLSENPKEPAIWELLGRVYANLGMQEKSDDAFKKADQYK
jgi:tetratricopeptide (TPR) repeat protein